MNMKTVYLVLAIVGAIVPYLFIYSISERPVLA